MHYAPQPNIVIPKRSEESLCLFKTEVAQLCRREPRIACFAQPPTRGKKPFVGEC
jgi:hypothetical protein